MALLQTNSNEDNVKALSILRDYGYTALASEQGPPVLAVSDELLEELEQQHVSFQQHTDESVRTILSEQGLSYYEYLCQHSPELLLFNASLPPLQHCVMSIPVPDYLIPAATSLLEQFNPENLEVKELLKISETSEEAIAQIEVLVHRDHQEAIIQAFADAGIAGYSRETKIIIQSDPDSK